MTRLRNVLAIILTTLVFIPVAHSVPISYVANLDGPSEDTPNASPGTGQVRVVFDESTHTLEIQVSFVDLQGPTTAAHIHAPTPMPAMGTAGVATQTPSLSGFPLGVMSGTSLSLLDTTMTSSFNAPFVTNNGGTAAGAESALAASLAAGTAYFNIHSTMFPGGEIRGFLQRERLAAVPVPPPLALAILGLLGIWGSRRFLPRS